MNTTLAVIDIGSNSIRMVLGQLLSDGKVQVLERFRQAVSSRPRHESLRASDAGRGPSRNSQQPTWDRLPWK